MRGTGRIRRRRRSAHPKAGFWLRLCLVVLYPLIVLFFRREVRGARILEGRGPAIIVINHVSHVDPLLLASIMWDAGWRPRFLAKASLFTIPIVGRAIRGTGQVPVHRGSADARTSLREAVAVLREGGRILIYPEGTVTRDPDGWPMEGKTGAARLALALPEVEVIPVGQWGARDSVDVYGKRIRLRPRRHVVYTVGQPLDLSAFAAPDGGLPSAEASHAATDVIMSAIGDLARQSKEAR